MGAKKSIQDLLPPEQRRLNKSTWHPSKKPGRKSGSGHRAGRLTIRCANDLNTVLHELQYSSWSYTGKSFSDIIHAAVKSLAKTQFPDPPADIANAIDSL